MFENCRIHVFLERFRFGIAHSVYLQTSAVLFIEQTREPQMEQKCAIFARSCAKASS